MQSRHTVFFAVLIFLASSCATAPGGSSLVSAGRGLQVTAPGDPARYRNEVDTATREVAAFFDAAGFGLAPEDLIDSVIVVDWTPESKAEFARSLGVNAGDVPETFAGTVVGTTLYLVTPGRYRAIWSDLYQDWPWTERAYHQLIVHEIAHRAHEEIAVRALGFADAMGPQWFFEGLAITCAGQFEDGRILTTEKVSSYIAAGASPPVSYPLYGSLVRSLLVHRGLRDLVLDAASGEFPLP